MSDVVPDYMTALVGYRSWGVTPDGDLLSLNQNTSEPWPAKTKKGAVCTQIRDEAWGPSQVLYSGSWTSSTAMMMSTSAYMPSFVQPAILNFSTWWQRKMVQKANANHHAPEAGCSCGVYAAKAKNHHFRSYRKGQPVWGEVYLWGKIQEYTEGYRAEFAYPKELSTSRADLVDKIANKYGVPVKVVGKKDAQPMSQQAYGPSMAWSTSAFNIANIGSMSTSVGGSYANLQRLLASTSVEDEDVPDEQAESSSALGVGDIRRRLRKWFV